MKGGGGYPVEMRDIQRKNELFFNNVKRTLCNEPVDILKALIQSWLKRHWKENGFEDVFCSMQYLGVDNLCE